MQRIRSKDTEIEQILRHALWQAGIRYRKNCTALPGKPDIAITKYKIAVFCDGEYFHGKDWENGQRERIASGVRPDYWVPKIERNIRRDRETDAALKGLGCTVLRFWGSDIKQDPQGCVKAVQDLIFERKLAEHE